MEIYLQLIIFIHTCQKQYKRVSLSKALMETSTNPHHGSEKFFSVRKEKAPGCEKTTMIVQKTPPELYAEQRNLSRPYRYPAIKGSQVHDDVNKLISVNKGGTAESLCGFSSFCVIVRFNNNAKFSSAYKRYKLWLN